MAADQVEWAQLAPPPPPSRDCLTGRLRESVQAMRGFWANFKVPRKFARPLRTYSGKEREV